VKAEEASLRIEELEWYASQEYGSLEEVVGRFLGHAEAPFRCACFGVAGPVRSGRARATNLPWDVDAQDLQERLGFPCLVLNDLVAAAWSIPALSPAQLAILNEGRPDPHGNGAVIAAGTGLGQAGLFWSGTELLPFSSEGGHTEFAPTNDQERRIQQALSARYGHVSWERIVSGPGLLDVHRVLSEERGGEDLDLCPLGPTGHGGGGPPDITKAARERRCPICADTVDQFCRSLGAKAGDLALTVLATRGVWIGGGIAPDILDFLSGDTFREAFTAKGRMKILMEDIPVRVILEEKAALLGAARFALRHVDRQ
jgi:glucokinase